ncbi:MAG: SCO family protein [Gemmatimonadetes bacterium]|nr:SCO family protein [Gemmatimonadota bacterium]
MAGPDARDLLRVGRWRAARRRRLDPADRRADRHGGGPDGSLGHGAQGGFPTHRRRPPLATGRRSGGRRSAPRRDRGRQAGGPTPRGSVRQSPPRHTACRPRWTTISGPRHSLISTARVTVAAASGGPALLTFAFGHCTTICETIVHDVRAARAAAGKAEVPLPVITLDPWRDTPSQLPSLAAHWRLEPQDRVLSGTVAEVESLLDQLGVTRQRNETTGDIVHVGTVMALDDRGHVVSRLDGGWGRVPQLLAGMPSPPAGVSAGSK